MATDPAQIALTPEQRTQLADLADRTGQPWQQILAQALAEYRRRPIQAAPTSNRSFYDAMFKAGAIGAARGDLPTDLATNPKHLEGFGRESHEDSD